MKIAHLVDSLSWGGAQTLLLTFVKTARYFNVEPVILGVKPDKSNSPLPKILEEAGARVVVFPFKKLYDPRAVPCLVKFFRSEGIEIVQTHLSHANIYGCVAGKLAGVPSVATLHNTRARSRGRSGIRSNIEEYCLRRGANRVIAVGQNVAEAFSNIVEDKRIDIIPNAVTSGLKITAEERQALRKELAGNVDGPILLAVGRLTAQKAYHNMLHAFAVLIKKHPKAVLVIVGRGDLDSELKQLVNSLGISDRVVFTGPRSDVRRLLSAGDVFLNSSLWEGLSIAMLEAMAAGLPIVATKVGDAEKLLSSGGGILVKVEDEQAFTNAIDYLLSNPEERITMGNAAQEFVEENYLAHAWFEKLLKTYAKAKGSA